MKVKLLKESNIYVIAPAGKTTGGPELLHQLVFNLRNTLNTNAYMYYFPESHINPIPNSYEHYSNPYVRRIVDEKKNVLIAPEIYSALKYFDNYKNITKIIWWLSIDNYYINKYSSEKKIFAFLMKSVNKLFYNINIDSIFRIRDISLRFDPIKWLAEDRLINQAHKFLVQSKYAETYLKDLNMNNINYLSDYLSEDFLEASFDISKKENIVAYNPKKGLSFTKKLIKFGKNIKFIPINNMSKEEVIQLLKRAKIYIDFGNHPGKDRIPREAAILGCCIITNRKGSAKFKEDVPILNDYKYEDKIEKIPNIVKKILHIFLDYENKVKDFDYYRNIIKKEKQKFINDLERIFIREKNKY